MSHSSSSDSSSHSIHDNINIISSGDDDDDIETIEHPLHPLHTSNVRRSPWAMFGQFPNVLSTQGGRPSFQQRSSFVQTLSVIGVKDYKEASQSLKSQVEYGNKVLLPASSLEKLSRLDIEYPMMFSVTTNLNEEKTHCGVLEFSAPEGMAIMPSWMVERLKISPSNSLATFKSISLPIGSFIKLKAQSLNFLEITDPKAVLEHSLRNFACLTLGDLIKIYYNDIEYGLLVEAVQPSSDSNGISVVETDLSVDFSAPVGYDEVERKMKKDLEDSKSILSYYGVDQISNKDDGKRILNLPKGCVYYGIRRSNGSSGSSNENDKKDSNNNNSNNSNNQVKPNKLK